jgi:hypothetical protein
MYTDVHLLVSYLNLNVSIMCVYVPVICFSSSEQITELGRISESFSHVIADNKCCFMDITFTEKVLYI